MEIEVIGATKLGTNKMELYKANQQLKVDTEILVDGEDGLTVAKVVKTNHKIEEEEGKEYLSFVRVLTDEDKKVIDSHTAKCKELEKQTKQFISQLNLQMKLIDVSLSFDGQKGYFLYVSEDRVDFRELVKLMANNFHIRIELKQVGVRDEARVKGGLGPCGRVCCCKGHLADFEDVTVKMAKNQNLSLNPQKISGLCGRLMCCLKYENEQYVELLKTLPKINTKILTDKGEGVVSFLDIFKQKITVKYTNENSVDYEVYTVDEYNKLVQNKESKDE